MRVFIVVILFSVCQQAFSIQTKCELSHISSFVEAHRQEKKNPDQTKSPQEADQLFYTIDSLDLNNTILASLWAEQSHFILDLVQYTEAQLLQLPEITKSSITKIKEQLLNKGLRLGMRAPINPAQEEEAVKKRQEHKLSLYIEFIDNIYSISENLSRSEFIEEFTTEVETLNSSHLYHPIKIESRYPAEKGAFKNTLIYSPDKLPDSNRDIRKIVLKQISFIVMLNLNMIYNN